MSRPIPKALLPHTIQYEEKTGEGSRGAVYATAIEVINVLVQVKEVRKYNKNSYEVLGKGTLVYDYRNSDPKTIIFSVRDRITYDGVIYFASEYTDQPTQKGQHHREIILT